MFQMTLASQTRGSTRLPLQFCFPFDLLTAVLIVTDILISDCLAFCSVDQRPSVAYPYERDANIISSSCSFSSANLSLLLLSINLPMLHQQKLHDVRSSPSQTPSRVQPGLLVSLHCQGWPLLHPKVNALLENTQLPPIPRLLHSLHRLRSSHDDFPCASIKSPYAFLPILILNAMLSSRPEFGSFSHPDFLHHRVRAPPRRRLGEAARSALSLQRCIDDSHRVQRFSVLGGRAHGNIQLEVRRRGRGGRRRTEGTCSGARGVRAGRAGGLLGRHHLLDQGSNVGQPSGVVLKPPVRMPSRPNRVSIIGAEPFVSSTVRGTDPLGSVRVRSMDALPAQLVGEVGDGHWLRHAANGARGRWTASRRRCAPRGERGELFIRGNMPSIRRVMRASRRRGEVHIEGEVH